MQNHQRIGLRLRQEFGKRERLAAVRLDPHRHFPIERREFSDPPRIIRDVGAGDELAHMLKRPAIERRTAPVGERDLRLH